MVHDTLLTQPPSTPSDATTIRRSALSARPPTPDAPAVVVPANNYVGMFGLAHRPFRPGTDAGDILLTHSQRTTLELLVAALLRADGHIVLLGDADLGKSALLNAALELIADARPHVVRIAAPSANTPLTFRHLLSAAQTARSLQQRNHDDPDWLFRPPAHTDRTILVIDDAHNMNIEVARYLAHLADQKALQIVLAGRADLRVMVRRPDMAPLAQTVTAWIRLDRMPAEELRHYVEQRLWRAGGSLRRVITPSALRLLLRQADGRPGRIDTLMDSALQAGFELGAAPITSRTIRPLLDKLPPPSLRPPRRTTRRPAPIILVPLAVLSLGLLAVLVNGTHPAQLASPPAVYRTVPLVMPDLVAQGDALLAQGDVLAARRLYERAASDGNAAAATAVGRTFDPEFQATLPAGQIRPDPASAIAWYSRAVGLGDTRAEMYLRRLAQ